MAEKMETKSIQDLFLHELAKTRQMESQLANILQDMSEDVMNEDLAEALDDHREETLQHVNNIEDAFSELGRQPDKKTEESLDALGREKKQLLDEVNDAKMEDAVQIMTAIKAEHLEMAQYENLLNLADQADIDSDVKDLLRENMEDEKEASKHLNDMSAGKKSLLSKIT